MGAQQDSSGPGAAVAVIEEVTEPEGAASGTGIVYVALGDASVEQLQLVQTSLHPGPHVSLEQVVSEVIASPIRVLEKQDSHPDLFASKRMKISPADTAVPCQARPVAAPCRSRTSLASETLP